MGVSVGTRVRIGRCDKAHVPCPLLTAVPLLARPFRPHPYPLVHRYVFAVFTDAGSWHSPATPQLDCPLFQIPQKSSLPWVASRAGVLALLALSEWRSAENLGSSCRGQFFLTERKLADIKISATKKINSATKNTS